MPAATSPRNAAAEPLTRRRFLQAGALALAGSCLPPDRPCEAAEATGPAAKFLLKWGKKGSAPGEFDFPIGVAVNRADEVLVTDFYNDRVQKFTPEGKFLAAFPVPPNPGPLALDAAGEIYISHFGFMKAKEQRKPDQVTVHSAAGKFLRAWGKTGTGDGEFDFPGGVAVSQDGRVYVADQTNRRVQVFDRRGKFLRKWGEYGTGPGQFGGNVVRPSRVGGPQFVALDGAGYVYTSEGSVGRVQKFTADGKYLLAWGDNQDKPGSFGGAFSGFKDRKTSLQGPVGLWVDPQGRVWVSAVCGRIQQFTDAGKYLRGFGGPGTGPGQFYAPHAIALDSRGHLYVVDAFNHRIQKFAV
jgi:DNA-binding beta-propeller fold protein YncE